MKKSPCYGCTKRHTACHSTCDDYISWKQERDELAEAMRVEREEQRKMEDASIKRTHKMRRGFR